MKTKLSFETLENKLTLSSVNISVHNCLWKEHHNYNWQKPGQQQIIVSKSGQIINYVPPSPNRPFPLFIQINFPSHPIGRPTVSGH